MNTHSQPAEVNGKVKKSRFFSIGMGSKKVDPKSSGADVNGDVSLKKNSKKKKSGKEKSKKKDKKSMLF